MVVHVGHGKGGDALTKSWKRLRRCSVKIEAVATDMSPACIDAVSTHLTHGTPEIFNTDQGVQYTATVFTDRLELAGVAISMDGRGRWTDNVFVERLWRTLKWEWLYLHDYATVRALGGGSGKVLPVLLRQAGIHAALNYLLRRRRCMWRREASNEVIAVVQINGIFLGTNWGKYLGIRSGGAAMRHARPLVSVSRAADPLHRRNRNLWWYYAGWHRFLNRWANGSRTGATRFPPPALPGFVGTTLGGTGYSTGARTPKRPCGRRCALALPLHLLRQSRRVRTGATR